MATSTKYPSHVAITVFSTVEVVVVKVPASVVSAAIRVVVVVSVVQHNVKIIVLLRKKIGLAINQALSRLLDTNRFLSYFILDLSSSVCAAYIGLSHRIYKCGLGNLLFNKNIPEDMRIHLFHYRLSLSGRFSLDNDS
ncbi:hypothetical protein Y032_0117g673 [Ancylostoma ceylanicum]|uniref:Uncharacterized protein n=1 Tax=Ancylostoma ceylanicum TaxID=53326 RepID=A0A016TB74_9BILA|nr:hypothetical protein Y032_0117g673 [Ancylostoma ceylanicum]